MKSAARPGFPPGFSLAKPPGLSLANAPYLLLLLALFLVPSPRAGEMLGDDLNEDDVHDYASIPQLRLSGQDGFSKWLYSPDSISSGYEKYLNRLGQGQCLSAGLAYFLWPRGGLGLNWIWFISRAEGSGFTERIGSVTPHSVDERISVWYAGPDFLTRLHLTQNTMLIGGLGVGYLNFTNTGSDNGKAFRVTAENYAIQAHVGADYSIFRFMALGIEGRFIFSNVREYVYNHVKHRIENPADDAFWANIPLYRFELSAGLHFML